MSEINFELIPNWSIWDPLYVQIQLFKEYDEEDNLYYLASLFIVVDAEKEYNVTLVTQIKHVDMKQCSKIAFVYASTLFPNIASAVLILGEDEGDEPEIFDLSTEKFLPDSITIH